MIAPGIKVSNMLFADIETAPIVEKFYQLPERLATIFEEKTKKQHGDDVDVSDIFKKEAGLQAEFAKVVCITVGYFKEGVLRIKSFTGNEKEILQGFESVLKTLTFYPMTGHNWKEFDGPFLCKRFIINGMGIPDKINNTGRKPWESTDIDTLEYWKFGVYGGKRTSLDLMAAVLDIPTPKDLMDGSMVGKFFYEGKSEEIATYCQKDVITVVRIIQRIKGEPLVKDENIQIA